MLLCNSAGSEFLLMQRHEAFVHIAKAILKQRDEVDIIILIGQKGAAGHIMAPGGKVLSADTGAWVWIPAFRSDYSTKIDTSEDAGDSRPPVPVLETAT